MRFLNFRINKRGQTLIELILVMALASLVLPAILTGLVASRNGKPQQEQRMQAIATLKETETAVKNIRNSNWPALSTNGTYHVQISGSQWILMPGSVTDSKGITQAVVISDVLRDATGAIVESAGNTDPSTKKVDINISWELPYPTTVSSTLYLTRTSNAAFNHTTRSDFNLGTATNTLVAATGGSATDGHMELAASGGGGGVGPGGGSSADWCEPNLSITALDLPKNGVANSISAIQGRVFAGTGDNSSGVSFANVAITDTDPPASSIIGTFNGYKTNDVFGESGYGYIATDTNSKEIIIVNLSNYTEVGNFNAPGNGDGSSVFVLGNTGYMASGSSFYTFDLSAKTGSRTLIDSINLGDSVKSIYVVGNYAYVALGSIEPVFAIINVANPSNISIVGDMNYEAGDGVDIFVNSAGTRAYLSGARDTNEREFFIINVTNKANPDVIGSYDTNAMNPKGVTVVEQHNIAIMVGAGGEEYQVIDISQESSPVRCGGLNIDTGVNGVSSVMESDGDAYSYIITGDASAELKIIEGGSGGSVATNWCSPETAIVSTLTLPRRGSALTAKSGEAFVGTGDGTSGVAFSDINITTSPSSSIIANYSAALQTNDVFSDGTYAYLAVNGATAQVRILNIATTPFSQIGTIDLPSGASANGVYVSGNIAYVTSSNKLYTFNIATKTGAHTTPLAVSDLYAGSGGTPLSHKVTVVGSKAFVSAKNTPYGLQVFNVDSAGSSLRLVGVSDLSWQQSATGLSVNATGTRAFVSFNNSGGSVARGFYIVDTSPSDPPIWWAIPNFYPIISTYSSGDTDPTGIALAQGTSTRALLTGTGGTRQYHVVDVSLEEDPVMCGGLSIAQGIKGVASVTDSTNKTYAYLITGESSNDFKILSGGSGGGNYMESGTFESSIFSSSTSAAFNRFVSSVAKPAQTTLRMQVATAPQVSGSCNSADFTYVGPDGSTTSFFNPTGNTIAATIPFGAYSPSYENPNKCFRYKTWFSTWNTSQTPILNDVTVNYSP